MGTILTRAIQIQLYTTRKHFFDYNLKKFGDVKQTGTITENNLQVSKIINILVSATSILALKSQIIWDIS